MAKAEYQDFLTLWKTPIPTSQSSFKRRPNMPSCNNGFLQSGSSDLRTNLSRSEVGIFSDFGIAGIQSSAKANR
jgi:hypothetical protein